jgi:hypothetical protein
MGAEIGGVSRQRCNQRQHRQERCV